VKRSPAKEVEVDLGEAGILVLQYPKVLTPQQRAHTKAVMDQIAATPGRQTIVLEAGVKYSVIQRGRQVVNKVTVEASGPIDRDHIATLVGAVGGPIL
jgi:hypothetical protein